MDSIMDKMTCKTFNKLRLERKLCDALIKVDGGHLHAHKNILCCCSPYFMALFTHDWYPPNKQEYFLPDVSSEIMELIMEYMYVRRVNVTQENVCELLIAADYLAVDHLVDECCVFLKDQLCVENCINIWRFAHFYFFRKLKQEAFQFILNNFKEMVQVSEEFLDLTVEQLSEILENDELNVKPENLVFDAILRWIEHERTSRKAHMGVLLPKVRMTLLTPNYFLDNVMKNTLVKDDEACKLLINSILESLNPNLNASLSWNLRRPRLPSAILLAIGGWSRGGPTNAIEAYDTQAQRWVNVTRGNEGPRAYAGTVYLNGFVYCVGGFNGFTYLSSVRKFDPVTRTWTQVGPMHSCRGYLSVCALGGQMYAMGGFDGHEQLNSAEQYDPENNQWSIIAPMHNRRAGAGATVLNGRVYICGGFDGDECLLTAEYYSPQTGQWTLIPDMNTRRSGLGVVTYDREIYAVGGFDGVNRLRSVDVFNPETNLWKSIPDMINKRSHFGIAVIDDRLFVVGGYDNFTTTNKVECYDKRADNWYAVTEMKVLRSALSCCVLFTQHAEYAAPRDPPEVPHSS